MLQHFKNFDKDRTDVHELVALLAFGKMLRVEYEELQAEEPEFVDTQIKGLKREIKNRYADAKAARLVEVESRLETLKTSSEKKSELLKEQKKLQAELAD